MRNPPRQDDGAYAPPGFEPLFDRYWKAKRRAQWFTGAFLLFAGIALGQAFWIKHLGRELRASERIRKEQAAKLAAFYAVTPTGMTPAEIIEQLEAKVAGQKRALEDFSVDMAALTWRVQNCEFTGPDPKRNPPGLTSGEVAETDAPGSGPTRTESE